MWPLLWVAVTGRKQTTVSGLIRLVISLECFIEITPDFLCPFMNACTVNFRATATGSYSCLNLYNFPYTNVRFLLGAATYYGADLRRGRTIVKWPGGTCYNVHFGTQ